MCKWCFSIQVVDGRCVKNVWPSEDWSRVMGALSLCIKYFIPLCIIVFCYARIIWTLSSSLNFNSPVANSTNENTHVYRLQVAKRNTAKTLVIVACCFVVCWSPVYIYDLIQNLGYYVTVKLPLFYFGYLNCAVNPFVYLAFYKDFHIGFKKLLSCVNKNNPGQTQSDISSISKETGSRADCASNQITTTIGELVLNSPSSEWCWAWEILWLALLVILKFLWQPEIGQKNNAFVVLMTLRSVSVV